MTGFMNNGAENPISKLTAATFQDPPLITATMEAAPLVAVVDVIFVSSTTPSLLFLLKERQTPLLMESLL